MSRPAVSVVVPFAGGAPERARLVDAFAGLRLGPEDELIVADNSTGQVLSGLPAPWRVVPALREGSPGYARNRGALHATRPWLLFVDSDCTPSPDLLDRFFAEPLAEDVGLVAGTIEPDPAQTSLAARFAASRAVVDQTAGLRAAFLPYALTANLLVRRRLWRELGGFLEGIFNGEDVDLAWRAQRAGWTLTARPEATVRHSDRETVRGLLRQASVSRASARWIDRRWPEAPLPPLGAARTVPRALAGAAFLLVTGRLERAHHRALDAAVAIARVVGDAQPNRARERARQDPGVAARRPLVVWCDEFPVISETFVINEVRSLAALGHPVDVVAGRRPDRPALGIDDVRVRYLEDDTRWERLRALLALAVRRPGRCLADVRSQRRWRAAEQPVPLRWLAPEVARTGASPAVHLHAHFAAGAALGAMRVARLTGRSWSVAAHGYDVFQLPRNLEEKLRGADLVIGPCRYTADVLRRHAGDRADRVREVVMGVDPERFQRRSPYPGGGTVVAVGRLVEKKGFADLVRAVADPRLDGLLDELVIVGDGPLRGELEALVAELGVAHRVTLAGRREPEEVRQTLEGAAVLAMPCVVAADGDRDAMPVVVKEALAMEIPVVATDEVGLPELVRPAFGRLVPPRDPTALAGALAELLALPAERRSAMGAAGRAHVVAHANVRTETAKLSALLDAAGRSAGPG